MNQSPLDPATSSTRRRFLFLGAAALTAPTALAVPRRDVDWPPLFHPLQRILRLRRHDCLVVRNQSAYAQLQSPMPKIETNDDETELTGFVGSFSKSLPHDALGVVDPAAYQALLKACNSGDSADFAAIPKGGTVKLANPQGALAFSLAGGDSHSFNLAVPPSFSSAWQAGEMVEVYLHALLRDVAFEDYDSDPLAADAITQLNDLADFRGPKVGGLVTAGTLFRGETAGDLLGNYASQFLLLPVPYGSTTITQRYRVTQQGDEHLTSFADWLTVQKGGAAPAANQYELTPRHIATARDLAEFVHKDFSYQCFLDAALILLGLGAPTNPGNPYRTSANQGGFVTFGAPDILTLVAQAGLEGLKAAWFHKWRVHRRLRPEEFGARVHQHMTQAAVYPIHTDLLGSPVLDDVFAAHGSYLLPMAYAEGCPTHPAYPAGHATIAGACVTVLKAFFDPAHVLAAPVQVDPVSDATALIPYSGSATLTVGGELNKLASNISIGRDLAGVHYRTDGTQGMLLGEQVAIRLLRDQLRTYNETPGTIAFTGFNGNAVTL